MSVHRLLCPVQNYAWGSHSFIAELQGRPRPTPEPEAELWMGAHAGAPSRLADVPGSETLAEFIARDRAAALGADVARRFDGELPFLVKVLAAAEPLSLQAHPNPAQARAGFAAEEAAGVPLRAAQRSYKDRRHKPELIVALTPFFALSGFRRVADTRRLFDVLAARELAAYTAPFARMAAEPALRSVFERVMSAPKSEQATLARATLAAARARADGAGEFAHELRWAVRLGELYPDDVGIFGALLLNLVRLEPYQGLYLPAGNLHAYLDGAGVEIMASSDNVLRGGLTPKHVNVTELLRVLEFKEFDAEPLRASRTPEGEHIYPTPAEEFRLSYFEVDGTSRVRERTGPEVLLATSGTLAVRASALLSLEQGGVLFVSADEPGYEVSGRGTLFRACMGRPAAA